MTCLALVEGRLSHREIFLDQGAFGAVKIGQVNSTLVKAVSTSATGPSKHAQQKHGGFIYFCKPITRLEAASRKHDLNGKCVRIPSPSTPPWYSELPYGTLH